MDREQGRRMSDLVDNLRKHATLMRAPEVSPGVREQLGDAASLLRRAADRIQELDALINTPHVGDFLEAVRLEAAHQCERWGVDNDAAKEPPDWFWLLGYLAGKALAAAIAGNKEKALHHAISTAAACLNWHAHISGERTRMRPGIEAPR
jgi:hypothetical protein